MRKITNPRQHKNGGKFIPKGIHKRSFSVKGKEKTLA